MKFFIDITGHTYGRLNVLRRVENKPGTSTKWLCNCSCGTEKIICSQSMRRGNTVSCGCFHKEQLAARVKGKPAICALPAGEAAFNELFSKYKKGAEKRGLPFLLTADEFRKLTKQCCFYCGKEPCQTTKPNSSTTFYTYNGIDRFDNSNGYSSTNSVPCCKRCNFAKHNLNAKEFLDWVTSVYEFQKQGFGAQ